MQVICSDSPAGHLAIISEGYSRSLTKVWLQNSSKFPQTCTLDALASALEAL